MEDPTPAMIQRGAAVLMRATGSPETIAHDVWQAMYDESRCAANQAPRATKFAGNTVVSRERFDALVEELTDANMEIARLTKA